MTALIYRNDGAWGTGKGARLTSLEGDGNIYTLDQRLAELEVDGGGKTIDYIGQDHSTGQLYIHYTDHSIDGPFDIPTMEWVPTGAFVGDHNYHKNEIFYNDGSLYLVLIDHTSPTVFDPFANDGHAHEFYALILLNPGNVLPNGGTMGQVLAKATDHDLDVEWIDLIGIPAGGSTGQVLIKHSDSDGDAEWADPSDTGTFIPVGGTTGQVLAKASDHDEDVEWIDVATSLATDSDVILNTPRNGDVLTYDGAHWYNSHLNPRGAVTITSSGNITHLDPHLGNIFKMTPVTEDTTITLDNTVLDGQDFFIEFATSGTTSYNITFSGTFVTAGTLATGTASGKKFVMHFVGYSSAPIEVSRTGAM